MIEFQVCSSLASLAELSALFFFNLFLFDSMLSCSSSDSNNSDRVITASRFSFTGAVLPVCASVLHPTNASQRMDFAFGPLLHYHKVH